MNERKNEWVHSIGVRNAIIRGVDDYFSTCPRSLSKIRFTRYSELMHLFCHTELEILPVGLLVTSKLSSIH